MPERDFLRLNKLAIDDGAIDAAEMAAYRLTHNVRLHHGRLRLNGKSGAPKDHNSDQIAGSQSRERYVSAVGMPPQPSLILARRPATPIEKVIQGVNFSARINFG